jgi:hypothetical protein
MTDAPAVIQATFSDWRTVKGRKQLQLIFEVPLEQQGEVLAMLGAPEPSNPRWYAIAEMMTEKQLIGALEDKGYIPKEQPSPSRDSNSTAAGAKRSWNELPPATQAGIRCGEKAFQKFVTENGYAPDDLGPEISGEDLARAGILHYCSIKSRSELSVNDYAWEKWVRMDKEYLAWMRT